MTFRAALIASFFLPLPLPLPLPLAAEPIVVVDREQVNIRENATTQSRRIEIGDHAEKLLRCVGWVHADLVQERYLVDGQGVRVRSGPTTGDGAIIMVYKG